MVGEMVDDAGGFRNLVSQKYKDTDTDWTNYDIVNNNEREVRKYRAKWNIRCIDKEKFEEQCRKNYLDYDKVIETHEIVQRKSGS